MRVLHIVFSMQIGGIETMLVDILNIQVLSNNNVSLLIINQDYNQDLLSKIDKRVSILYVNRAKKSKNIFNIFKLNRYVQANKPDVIHFHENKARNILLYRKAVKILTVHDVNLSISNLYKFDSICAISNSVKKDLLTRYNVDSRLIYNGVCFDSILSKKVNCENISSEFRILQISRLNHYKKGQDVLLKALFLLRNKPLNRDIRVDFIGEGDSLMYLQDLAAEYRIEDKVRFLGAKDRDYIYQNICNYNLLVQPSIYEGFGLTVAEGMAAKIPVLVSDNDGPMEIIHNGKYGSYFEKGNAENCANAISIIVDNIDNMNFRAEDAYRYAFENFNIEKTVAAYLDLYEELHRKKIIVL